MITNPNKHFFQDQMDGLFVLLSVMSLLSLALGLLLVYNTMNAVISAQVNQIGVLKAVGARTGQVFRLFLTETFLYGLLALLLALPIGIFGAYAISSWLVSTFGANFGGFEYSPPAVLAMAAIALVAPLLASIFPIISGARITVREAISTYGLNKKAGLIERVGAHEARFTHVPAHGEQYLSQQRARYPAAGRPGDERLDLYDGRQHARLGRVYGQ